MQASTVQPKVVVLILSYNGRHLLRECLSSYINSDYTNFKIVVIDNGSSDETEDYVKDKFPDVQVLRLERNVGYSQGFNQGMKFATEETNANFFLISNNDVYVDEKAISELVKVGQQNSKIGFVTGKATNH